jgi:hypothetical protein
MARRRSARSKKLPEGGMPFGSSYHEHLLDPFVRSSIHVYRETVAY